MTERRLQIGKYFCWMVQKAVSRAFSKLFESSSNVKHLFAWDHDLIISDAGWSARLVRPSEGLFWVNAFDKLVLNAESYKVMQKSWSWISYQWCEGSTLNVPFTVKAHLFGLPWRPYAHVLAISTTSLFSANAPSGSNSHRNRKWEINVFLNMLVNGWSTLNTYEQKIQPKIATYFFTDISIPHQ